jgi:AcrR family transcriptional regulator
MSEKRTEDGDQPRSPGRRERDLEIRRATERAMLEICGEVGYERATVASVLERSGSNLARFYDSWSGKAGCYETAYAAAADALSVRLLSACAEAPDWSSGMKQALKELACFTAEDPALAAGLVREVHVVGGPALIRRDELAGRLAQAVDRAREAPGRLRPGPPPATAAFVIQGIEAAVVRGLADKQPPEESLPGLLFLAVSLYFGAEKAQRVVPPSQGS